MPIEKSELYSSPGSAGLQPGNDRNHAEQELGAPSETAASRPGLHSRGYLPHRDQTGLLQSLTFRLADSLPQEKLRHLEEELTGEPEAGRDVMRLYPFQSRPALREPAVVALVKRSPQNRTILLT